MLRSLGDFRLIKIKKALEISIIMAQQFLYFDDESCGFYNVQSILHSFRKLGTVQKINFFVRDFFSKCEQILRVHIHSGKLNGKL